MTLYNVCSVPWGAGGAQYCEGCSVPCGDIMSTVGDILSTVWDVQHRGGYHEYHGVFSTVGVLN